MNQNLLKLIHANQGMSMESLFSLTEESILTVSRLVKDKELLTVKDGKLYLTQEGEWWANVRN